jgi:hypothetical protein
MLVAGVCGGRCRCLVLPLLSALARRRSCPYPCRVPSCRRRRCTGPGSGLGCLLDCDNAHEGGLALGVGGRRGWADALLWSLLHLLLRLWPLLLLLLWPLLHLLLLLWPMRLLLL